MTDQPSDRLLRIVSIAAESGSFSAAAQRLGIGQPAVSHAVAGVEEWLGCKVFDRSHLGIRPTPDGQELLTRLTASFLDLDRAVGDARVTGETRPVTLSVSTSLATYWLAPRLPEFKLTHPDVQLRVITTDSDDGVGRDDADLWIPLGPIDDRQLDSVDFCVEELIPVAAPALASTIDGTAGPAALLDQPLLHLEERYVPRYDWARWFANFGIETATTLSGVRSNDYSLILHAALSGNGLALGWRHIVDALLVDGSLVAIGPAIETGSSFPLLRRAGRPLANGGAALHSWLLSEIGRVDENGREAGSEDPASLRMS